MRWLVLFALLSSPALAETWTGSAHVVDGDTIYVDQARLRLLSMDAFETAQNCEKGGKDYACGLEATLALITLTKNQKVTCEGNKRDRYDRPLVHCRIGDIDLGREMVRLGWALSEYGSEYKSDQEFAQQNRNGAWAGTFQRPQEWRNGQPQRIRP